MADPASRSAGRCKALQERTERHYRLAEEWRLNYIQLMTLYFIQDQGGEVTFDEYRESRGITAQHGETLRALARRGFLDGPADPKKEKVRARPFKLTDQAVQLLAKIERGLHPLEWLTDKKASLLRFVAEKNISFQRGATHPAVVKSLKGAGYLDEQGQLTDLGREAWQNWHEDQARKSQQ